MYIGLNDKNTAVTLDSKDLLTHGVILGRTGSGKSGLVITLLEEIAATGAGAIVLDPKGDLANLALSLATPEEFAKWSDDPFEAYFDHQEGLKRHGLSLKHVEWWRDNVDVTIYAPGKIGGGGKPLSVFPTFTVPLGDTPHKDKITREVSTVLRSIDSNDDPYSPALVFMTQAVMNAWGQGLALPVEEWPGVLTRPPEGLRSFGGMKLDDFFPKSQRTKLARKLIGFHHQSEHWTKGAPLDLRLIAEGAQKPQLAVISLRHLSEDDRQFLAALVLNKVVDFMYETSASEELKLAVVLDEARGYLPPHPHNPPTKDPICTILAQGRAQGIGMLVGTQNPMDLDYKALSNVGTWFVGKLRERDCRRDLGQELANRNVDKDDVISLPQRNFLLLDKHGKTKQFRTRWCYNHLFGPMSDEQLARLD